MLGDCEITGVDYIPPKMTKDENQSLPDDRSLTSPPPAKKLKQARLPFKILDQKPIAPKVPAAPTSTKKRKPSDGAAGPQKACKIQRNDENGRRTIPKQGDAENEVSSSSEAENQSKPTNTSKCDKPRGLERFVQSTQQLEVSTSSEVVDLTDDVSNPSNADKESSDNAKTATQEQEKTEDKEEDIEAAGEDADAKEEPAKREEEIIEDKTKECDAVDADAASKNELDESVLSQALDTTDASLRTDSSDDESNDESESGQSKDESTPSTPATPSQSLRKRPPLSSTKKVQKDTERESKRLEREKLKAEKMRQKELEKQKKEEQRKERERIKEELRLEKEKQKQEEKDRKEAEKNRKEKERLEKLAEKEREKLEKQKQKEEEKKKKQEALDAKAEEKKKKEEEKEAERKRKEEEKSKHEVEKSRKIQQSQAIFKSFFKKVEKTDEPPKITEHVGSFAAFQVLKNMKMAPVHRVPRDVLPKRCEELDRLMSDQCCDELYVTALRNGATKPGTSPKTWPSDDVVIVDPAEPQKPQMKAKLYQFHENYRPAYFGTWRKRSKNVSPRNPFKKDEIYMDYDVDSDDEWEEEEPGESLSNSEGEGEDQPAEAEADDEDDDDGFFVPHGYLSDGEGCEEDEEECNPEKMKMRQMIKAKNFEAEMKKATEILRMVTIGCCWLQGDNKFDPRLELYKAEVLTDESPIDLSQESSQDDKAKSSKEKRGIKIQGVPDEAMSYLIRLVHGNLHSLKKLIKEFIIFWKRHQKGDKDQEEAPKTGEEAKSDSGSKKTENSPSQEEKGQKDVDNEEDISCAISKRQLDLKIRSIACYEKRAEHRLRCWYVHEEVLKKYELTDIPIPTDWNWITKPGKVKNNEEGASPSVVPKKEQPQTNPNQGSIKQFAVPGVVQNLVPLPSVQSAKTAPSTPGQKPTQANKKTPKRIKPITLFCAKGSNPSSSSSCQAAQDQKCPPVPQHQEAEDDCMIVDAPFVPPPPSKAQPTLTTMFGQAGKK